MIAAAQQPPGGWRLCLQSGWASNGERPEQRQHPDPVASWNPQPVNAMVRYGYPEPHRRQFGEGAPDWKVSMDSGMYPAASRFQKAGWPSGFWRQQGPGWGAAAVHSPPTGRAWKSHPGRSIRQPVRCRKLAGQSQFPPVRAQGGERIAGPAQQLARSPARRRSGTSPVVPPEAESAGHVGRQPGAGSVRFAMVFEPETMLRWRQEPTQPVPANIAECWRAWQRTSMGQDDFFIPRYRLCRLGSLSRLSRFCRPSSGFPVDNPSQHRLLA